MSLSSLSRSSQATRQCELHLSRHVSVLATEPQALRVSHRNKTQKYKLLWISVDLVHQPPRSAPQRPGGPAVQGMYWTVHLSNSFAGDWRGDRWGSMCFRSSRRSCVLALLVTLKFENYARVRYFPPMITNSTFLRIQIRTNQQLRIHLLLFGPRHAMKGCTTYALLWRKVCA